MLAACTGKTLAVLYLYTYLYHTKKISYIRNKTRDIPLGLLLEYTCKFLGTYRRYLLVVGTVRAYVSRREL